MFAFSQITASGVNPTQAINELENEIKNRPKVKNNGLDDDESIAAFSEYISGDASDIDPVKVLAEKKKAE